MTVLQLSTIGFTKKSAEDFFRLLRSSGARRVLDVRLNNVSQLAGFAKKADLEFFLREICDMEYLHAPELAPTKEILDAYKKHGCAWNVYEAEFMNLMERRCVERTIPRELVDQSCLLCSEHEPHHCHRRLVAEYLDEKWGGVIADHLT
jgi:uncharacterized protein (DUF488 family)